MKNANFCVFYEVNLEASYFNGPSPKVDYFYIENGLEVIFLTTLQNRKPQMPRSYSADVSRTN